MRRARLLGSAVAAGLRAFWHGNTVTVGEGVAMNRLMSLTVAAGACALGLPGPRHSRRDHARPGDPPLPDRSAQPIGAS